MRNYIRTAPKIKKMFAKKPVDAPIQQVNQNYDFVPSDDNYFTFKGRIGRKVFIKRTAFAYLGIILVALFFAWLTDSTSKIEKNPLYIALILAFMVPFTLFLYANMNRRFHDIGKSSNWTLAMFLASNTVAPIYFLALLYLFCKKVIPTQTNMAQIHCSNKQRYFQTKTTIAHAVHVSYCCCCFCRTVNTILKGGCLA